MIDTAALAAALGDHLPAQRWYAGDEVDRVEVLEVDLLREGPPHLLWALIDAPAVSQGRGSPHRYQLLLGVRPALSPPAIGEAALIGNARLHRADVVLYDATADPELLPAIGCLAVPDEEVSSARRIGAEQSNTSIVLDERTIVKLYRRVGDGPNPEVEVISALSAVGFDGVPPVVGVWRRDGRDLAIAQRFLPAAIEGWAHALTSLRDLYGESPQYRHASDAGGDFAPEARRLGTVTASMHRALAEAFGTHDLDPGWADGIVARASHLDEAMMSGPLALVERARGLASAGGAIRVHGDYHLGQVLRSDEGWFVLDFEGEPAASLAERTAAASPAKDVAGMLRSFHYATQVALHEHDDRHDALAGEWEQRNRDAFLDGYADAIEGSGLVPDDHGSLLTLVNAFEVDKAAYELQYERAHRPDWVSIPESALRRLGELAASA